MDFSELYFFGSGSYAFDDIEYWAFILVFAAIYGALLLANFLIRSIKFLRKSLIPAPVLGGFILLAFLAIVKAIIGKPLFNPAILEMITYHGLGLGFVATALKTKDAADAKKTSGIKAQRGIIDSSLVTVSTYLIQGIIGLAVSICLYFAVKAWPASGVLVPMGFGQGPGQALNWGTNYSNLSSDPNAANFSQFGPFNNGISFGLTIAALGFVASSIGGIIYLNIQRKKGNVKFVSKEDEVDDYPFGPYAGKDELPMSGTIDKFSVQVGTVLLAYAVSFAIIFGISKACDASGVKFLINTVKPLFWGFNFIVGTGVAVLFRAIFNKLYKKKILKKLYLNNFMLDRISGTAFDFMVVAAIGSISLSAFTKLEFILPLLVMSILAAVGSFFYVKHCCKVLYSKDGYYEESFLCLYGMLTGTASTGVILLREIDPKFKTPACSNMVYQTIYSVAFGAPVLLLMSTVAQGWKGLGIGVGVYVIYFIVIYLLIRRETVFKKAIASYRAKKGIVDEEVSDENVADSDENAEGSLEEVSGEAVDAAVDTEVAEASDAAAVDNE